MLIAYHCPRADHLALNGGRAMHWSRGFLHDLDKRAALASLRDELADGSPRDWHLEPYDESREPNGRTRTRATGCKNTVSAL